MAKIDELKEHFSQPLKDMLTFMEDTLSQELPTVTLTPYYFVYSLLSVKNMVLSFIEDNLTSMAIDAIRNSYYQYISSKALSAIKPSRKIQYSDELIKYFEDAVELAKDSYIDEMPNTYFVSDKKGIVRLGHVFVAMLNDESDDNKIKKVFNKAGITSDVINESLKLTDNSSTNTESVKKEDKKENIKVKVIELTDTDVDSNKIFEAFKRQTGDFTTHGLMNKKKESFISKYCSNLNDLVDQGKIDALIGREKETNSILRILGRKKKNNIIIVGGEGLGKTALCENIAYKIAKSDVPEFLIGKVIVSLDMTALMAGTTLRGMFEERVKGLLDELKNNPKYILFIDNIGAALADKGKNDYDISSMLSRSLENGECQVIGTSDFTSYRKTFDKDPSLARRFQKMVIEAPTLDESLEILRGIKKSYENFHKVTYTDKAIETCVYLANRFISERNLPDSAIDLLDEAGSLYGTVIDNPEVKMARQEIVDINDDIVKYKIVEDYNKVDELGKKLNKQEKKIKDLLSKAEKDKVTNPIVIDEDKILDLISEKTGIPVSQLSSDDKCKLTKMNERLKQEVIGQDEAIDLICKALKRNRIGLSSHGTMFSGMLIGASGSGKTLTAKKLAKEMFGDEKSLIRFDMSEYPDKTAVNKLIGSNPGYVGYEEGGQLTESIKNKKHCVLLLDEIEKADPEVYNIFLQVLDEGFLTDNCGQRVDFSNVIVLFTSNVGAKQANDFGKGIGFNTDENANKKNILLKSLKNRFPPEFLNRLNSIIYFNSLTDDNLKDIIKIELNKTIKRMTDIGYKMKYDDKLINKLFSIVKDEKEFGARPIIRAIQDNVEDKITDMILENEIDKGYEFSISTDDKEEVTVA